MTNAHGALHKPHKKANMYETLATRNILALTKDLDPVDLESLRQSCLEENSLHLECRSRFDETEIDPGPLSLLVAGLPAGRRRIPDDLAFLVTKVYPGLPLLLYCAEDLTEDYIELQEGMVILSGLPRSPRKTKNSIARAISNSPKGFQKDAAAAFGSLSETAVNTVRELHAPRWWTGVILSSEEQAGCDAEAFPYVKSDADAGLAVFLASDISAQPSSRSSDALSEELLALTPKARSRRLADSHSGQDSPLAIFLMDAESRRCTLSCPTGSDLSMWLFSKQRLPNLHEISSSKRQPKEPHKQLSATAHPGDLILVSLGLTKLPWGGEIDAELAKILNKDFGPGLLQAFGFLAKGHPDPFAAVIVEVR